MPDHLDALANVMKELCKYLGTRVFPYSLKTSDSNATPYKAFR